MLFCDILENMKLKKVSSTKQELERTILAMSKKKKGKKMVKTYGHPTVWKKNMAGVIKKAAEQAEVASKKYPVVECLNMIKNFWIKPEIDELIITGKTWLKMMAYINLIGDYEISGFGKVEVIDGKHYVTDVDIIKQEVRGAYVESSADAVMDFIRRVPKDERALWTLDWHSHVNMGTSPSGTDWTNYSSMLEARLGNQFPIMIINKRQEATSYQILGETRHTKIEVKVMEETLAEDEIVSLYNECKEKVENLCTKYTASSTVYTGTNKSNSGVGSYFNSFYGKNDFASSDSWQRGKQYAEDEDDYAYSYGTASSSGLNQDDYEDDIYDMYCTDCGRKLKTPQEQDLGVCSHCWTNYEN